jgi:hypothetical protein
MSEFRDTIIALKIISKVEAGQRLNVRSYTSITAPSWYTTIIRTLMFDSREHTLEYIENTLFKAFAIVDQLTLHASQTYGELCSQSDMLKQIIMNLHTCQTGLRNLCTTYNNDKTTVARLELLIERIDLVVKAKAEYLQAKPVSSL